MEQSTTRILAVNVGSSSVKITLFDGQDGDFRPVVDVACEGVSLPDVGVVTVQSANGDKQSQAVQTDNHEQAVDRLLEAVQAVTPLNTIAAIGHRIVFGGTRFDQPTLVNDGVIAELHQYFDLDPDHMPYITHVLEVLRQRFPNQPHVACFDSAFFSELPTIAKLLPIPRKYAAMGIVKHGYHGLNCTHLLAELQKDNASLAHGKVVFCHLGSGCSVTAVANGKAIDTTMSFTPTSGIPMSARSGDLDPSIARYLLTTGGLSIEDFNHMVNHESGLKGISETTADMLTLLHQESHDPRSADAINLFCYNIRKAIGAMSAALGGLDAIVFSGGIGERSSILRHRICDGLQYLNVDLDHTKNEQSWLTISSEGTIPVYVMHADEAIVIAQQTNEIINTQA